jgi:hypothetical protein
MKCERKFIKFSGDEYHLGPDGKPVKRTRKGAIALGKKLQDAVSKKHKFQVSIFETGDYFRISYGRAV